MAQAHEGSAAVVNLENNQNPFEERRAGIQQWKNTATMHVHDSESLRTLARTLHGHGLKPLDALHVAAGISAGATHFLTVDDRVLNKRSNVRQIDIASPVDFVRYYLPTV